MRVAAYVLFAVLIGGLLLWRAQAAPFSPARTIPTNQSLLTSHSDEGATESSDALPEPAEINSRRIHWREPLRE